ncbi:MAG: gliding motility-associated C-terminal domain-containing protein, partial [Bacteroidia bacterium]|nr:gliding motility-associated C-terminal domain-containing protein [Bacteroidia bacterium]
TGSINLNITGGTSPYHYIWSGGQTTGNLTSLTAGTYIVTVTDNNGCTATNSSVISQPASPLSLSTVVTPVLCFNGNNGAIDLTVTGGISPYQYHWSNNATSQDITGIIAGNYSVTVIDNNFCQSSASSLVTGPSAALSIYASVTDVSCNGGSNGAIDLLVTGGTSPYSFLWNNSSTNQNTGNLVIGTYSVTVTDSHGCAASSSYTITQPDNISLIHTQSDVSCFGDSNGSINLYVLGGNSPFTYHWSNNDTTQDISNLVAGIYSVTVNDANGCPPAYATVTITQPQSALSVLMTAINVNCTGGSDGAINATVTGGIQPYTYLWSNNATVEDISGLTAGTYSISITDYNFCYVTGIIVVSQPDSALSYTYTIGQVSCHGVSDAFIDLTVTGGTTPYSYIWSNGATTQDLIGIPADNYFVTITDHNGCSHTQAFAIVQPLLLVLDAQITIVSCYADSSGSIDLTVNGGITPYQYSWSTGSTNQDISSLTAGTYLVTVSDNNNCIGTGSYVISQPGTTLNLSILAIALNCFSDTSGTINLSVSGGNQPYHYTWSNGATSQDLTGLTIGVYSVTVIDANGCMQSDSTNVNSANLVHVTVTVTSIFNGYAVSCYGGSDGMIDLTVNGGTPPYSYSWNNGLTDQNLIDVQSGTYYVTVTDLNGCNDVGVAYLIQPPQLTTSESVIHPTCPDFADGSIALTVSGGVSPYNYNWSNLQVLPAITALPEGVYTVTITDGNNCTLVNEYTLSNIYEQCIFIPSAFTPNGDGFNDIWNIRGIDLYPNTIIDVYNRWGQLLFRSDIGYHQKWDGKFNGNILPSDTYHYVVNLRNGKAPIIGTVTIVR